MRKRFLKRNFSDFRFWTSCRLAFIAVSLQIYNPTPKIHAQASNLSAAEVLHEVRHKALNINSSLIIQEREGVHYIRLSRLGENSYRLTLRIKQITAQNASEKFGEVPNSISTTEFSFTNIEGVERIVEFDPVRLEMLKRIVKFSNTFPLVSINGQNVLSEHYINIIFGSDLSLIAVTCEDYLQSSTKEGTYNIIIEQNSI